MAVNLAPDLVFSYYWLVQSSGCYSPALHRATRHGNCRSVRFTPAQMVRLISYVAVPALVGSLALVLIDPSNAITYAGQLRGTFIHKNSLGGFAALAILTLIARQTDNEYRNAAARAPTITRRAARPAPRPRPEARPGTAH
jgi:hypothetical protein